MKQTGLTHPTVIKAILAIGIGAILLFPSSTYELTSQEWWLPAILVLLAAVGIVQLIRKSTAPWPLFLICFSQGFNIISRLLMLMPQSTQKVGSAMVLNGQYLIMTVISMVVSGFILWYLDKPEVKQQLA
jgi:hypothetical protein